MKINLKGHKGIAVVSAAVAAATIIFGGTFAWQSISQQYKNEADGYINPGGRLHDDFNGSNKDVYVENFTDPDDFGVPIFARVRMHEYMEIGEDAGNTDNPGRTVEIVGKQDSDIEHVETWQIHIPGNTMEEADKELHKYWKWEMGGQTVYMPTFNKNKDDLEVDVNGSFAGPDGIKGVNPDTNADDKYEDYVEYKMGDSRTDTAQYAGGVATQETHEAKETLNATVLTMAQWKAQGSPKGNFWVYDVDGWAYWADAIQPGEATGPLLGGISFARMPDNGWYYGINVEGQFATVGDWGEKADGSGFYKDGMTEDGLFVLNQAAGRLPSITDIQPKNGYRQYAKAGQNFLLEVNMDIEYPSGSPGETAVKWTSQPETNRLYNNTFAPTKDMVGQTYTFTATSMYDPTKSVNLEVYVYPSDAAGVQIGDDGKEYVDYGDNTFKPINADGTLGAFICAGEDMKMGTTDDRYDVEVLDTANATFGSKFIGPNTAPNGVKWYYAIGNDGLLGTADDIPVTGNPWSDNIEYFQDFDYFYKLPNITPGDMETVLIDDIDWYVLAKDGNKALIWSKEIVTTIAFGQANGQNRWINSVIREKMNGELLESLTFLKTKVVETEINTRSQHNASTWDSTKDKLFLLSQADVFGTHANAATSDSRDYTYGNSKLVNNLEMIKYTSSSDVTKGLVWLRTPRYTDPGNTGLNVAVIKPDGTIYNCATASQFPRGVRPAMWIEMP